MDLLGPKPLEGDIQYVAEELYTYCIQGQTKRAREASMKLLASFRGMDPKLDDLVVTLTRALHAAVWHGRRECVKMLLTNQAFRQLKILPEVVRKFNDTQRPKNMSDIYGHILDSALLSLEEEENDVLHVVYSSVLEKLLASGLEEAALNNIMAWMASIRQLQGRISHRCLESFLPAVCSNKVAQDRIFVFLCESVQYHSESARAFALFGLCVLVDVNCEKASKNGGSMHETHLKTVAEIIRFILTSLNKLSTIHRGQLYRSIKWLNGKEYLPENVRESIQKLALDKLDGITSGVDLLKLVIVPEEARSDIVHGECIDSLISLLVSLELRDEDFLDKILKELISLLCSVKSMIKILSHGRHDQDMGNRAGIGGERSGSLRDIRKPAGKQASNLDKGLINKMNALLRTYEVLIEEYSMTTASSGDDNIASALAQAAALLVHHFIGSGYYPPVSPLPVTIGSNLTPTVILSLLIQSLDSADEGGAMAVLDHSRGITESEIMMVHFLRSLEYHFNANLDAFVFDGEDEICDRINRSASLSYHLSRRYSSELCDEGLLSEVVAVLVVLLIASTNKAKGTTKTGEQLLPEHSKAAFGINSVNRMAVFSKDSLDNIHSSLKKVILHAMEKANMQKEKSRGEESVAGAVGAAGHGATIIMNAIQKELPRQLISSFSVSYIEAREDVAIHTDEFLEHLKRMDDVDANIEAFTFFLSCVLHSEVENTSSVVVMQSLLKVIDLMSNLISLNSKNEAIVESICSVVFGVLIDYSNTVSSNSSIVKLILKIVFALAPTGSSIAWAIDLVTSCIGPHQNLPPFKDNESARSSITYSTLQFFNSIVQSCSEEEYTYILKTLAIVVRNIPKFGRNVLQKCIEVVNKAVQRALEFYFKEAEGILERSSELVNPQGIALPASNSAASAAEAELLSRTSELKVLFQLLFTLGNHMLNLGEASSSMKMYPNLRYKLEKMESSVDAILSLASQKVALGYPAEVQEMIEMLAAYKGGLYQPQGQALGKAEVVSNPIITGRKRGKVETEGALAVVPAEKRGESDEIGLLQHPSTENIDLKDDIELEEGEIQPMRRRRKKSTRQRQKSRNPYVDAMLYKEGGDDGYEDLEDFVVCERGKNYY